MIFLFRSTLLNANIYFFSYIYIFYRFTNQGFNRGEERRTQIKRLSNGKRSGEHI
jgi:hypothetical protein